MLERRFIEPQLIELVLREVADLKALAAAQFARHERQLAHDRFDEGRLPGAVDAENADALARADAEGDIRKNAPLAIAHGESLRIDEMLREPLGLEEFEAPLALGAHGLHRLQALEHFDARLRLACLCCFVAEAFDVACEVRSLRLVGLSRRVLLTELFNSRSFKLAVVACVARNGAVFDRPDRGDGAVEEFAVVRDDDDR